MRYGVLLSVLVLTQLFAGCASRSAADPFSIPREEFQRTAQTIALAPVMAPPGIEVAESLLVRIDTLIEAVLLGAGYRCVPRREYVATWDRIIVQMGGLYDSVTGDLDELRFEVAKEQLRRDLLDMYHPDYLLYPEIWIVAATFSDGVARWDGTSQSLVGFGTRVLNVIDAVLGQYDGFLPTGAVSALSLGVTVENMDGVEIFQNAGGIEVLEKVSRDVGRAEPVLIETILTDPERNQRAVITALFPLVEGREGNSPLG